MKRYQPGQNFVGMPEADPELDKPVLTPEQIRRELERFDRLSYRFDVAYGVRDDPKGKHTRLVLTLVLVALVFGLQLVNRCCPGKLLP
jgi:hypothetical protein